MMTRNEDIAFTEFLIQKAAEAEALGYRPTKFKQMLGAQGGEATVRQLLAKGRASDGFTRLYELGRLDLTIEALVVETQWRALIDPILVRRAERLLTEVRYAFSPFGAPAQPSVIKEPEPPKPKRTFSEFCKDLGAELTNFRDRWCGYNRERGYALFTIWADELQNDRYVLWDWANGADDTRAGARELKQVITAVMEAGHAAYGIRCEAENPFADTRKRQHFDEDQLLVLRLTEEGDKVVAIVVGEIPAADIAEGRRGVVTPFDSAIDDLGSPPPGHSVPERKPIQGGSGYRRDPAVRGYVVRRSKGRCEYCGERSFELPDKSHYVEAHHIIALSTQGPDRIDNVIALCPEHHREAHYGQRAADLEKEFLEILRKISS